MQCGSLLSTISQPTREHILQQHTRQEQDPLPQIENLLDEERDIERSSNSADDEEELIQHISARK